MNQTDPRTDLFGEEQPEVIWLGTYKHSGEVRWEAIPEEDSDEFQAVKYVRADLIGSAIAAAGRSPETRSRLGPKGRQSGGVAASHERLQP